MKVTRFKIPFILKVVNLSLGTSGIKQVCVGKGWKGAAKFDALKFHN
jgi:hypothetical protein